MAKVLSDAVVITTCFLIGSSQLKLAVKLVSSPGSFSSERCRASSSPEVLSYTQLKNCTSCTRKKEQNLPIFINIFSSPCWKKCRVRWGQGNDPPLQQRFTPRTKILRLTNIVLFKHWYWVYVFPFAQLLVTMEAAIAALSECECKWKKLIFVR